MSEPLTPGDDIVLKITAPPGEALEWLQGEAYRYDLVRKLEAWLGEFGALDVATALAYAYASRECKRRGLLPTGRDNDE